MASEPNGNTWTPAEIKAMLARQQLFRAHAFELACAPNDVEHRLTKPRHPWASTPLDEWAGRADEPHHQGGDCPGLLLRHPRPAAHAPGGLRGRLQLRPSPQNLARPHPIRVHLQTVGDRAPAIHAQPTP